MQKPPLSRLLKTGFLLLGCCLLLAAALRWNSFKTPTAASSVKPSQPSSLAQQTPTLAPTASLPQKAAPAAVGTGKKDADLSKFTYANGWKSEAKPAFAPFNHWVAQYLNTPVAARATLESEGERLAEERRKAMEELIQKDPKEAIASTVPADILPQLPLLVLNHIEKRVSGKGNYEVNVLCFLNTKDQPDSDTVNRQVVFSGSTYKAFAYGRRGTEPTKYNIPLHGIALGNLMAVHESPIRVLESGEQPAAGSQIVSLPLSAPSQQAIAIQVGNVTVPSISISQALQLQSEVNSAEIIPGPYVQFQGLASQVFPTDAPSPPYQPWTTGTTRILLIRVDFSDFQGEPITQGNAQGLMDGYVKPFYEQGSYYKDTLVTTVTGKTYRMPFSGAAYSTGSNIYTSSDPFHSLDQSQLHSDAEALAIADGYDLNNYDRIGVVFPYIGGISKSIWSGVGGLADIGGRRFWIDGEFDLRVVAHELGHTYGLWHANLWQTYYGSPVDTYGSSTEYGDPFDMMGRNSDSRALDFGPSRKMDLGWIAPSAITTATTSGVYRVYNFDNAGVGSNNNLALAIKKSNIFYVLSGSTYVQTSSDYSYWVSYRKKNVSDSNLPGSAYVFWRDDSLQYTGTDGFPSGGNFDGNFAGYTNLLDMNTPGYNTADAGLVVGQSVTDYSDASNVLTLTTLKKGGVTPNEYLDVQVSFNNAVGFAQSAYDVQEAQGSVDLVVNRTGDGVGFIKVDYTTINGTAKTPGDYLGAAGTLTWQDGDTSSRTITVPLRPGTLVNGVSSFTVQLNNALGGYTNNGTATVRIHDPGASNPQFHPPVDLSRYLYSFYYNGRYYYYGGLYSNLDGTTGAITIPNGGWGLDLSGSFVLSSGSYAGPVVYSEVTNVNLNGGLNGSVNSVATQPDGKIVVGGAFNQVNLKGSATVYAGVSIVSGTHTYPIISGTTTTTGTYYTYSTVYDYYSGSLNVSGDVPGYARLNAYGNIDRSFGYGESGIPDASDTPAKAVVLQPDGATLIGGAFDSISGYDYAKIARLRSDGYVDYNFTPDSIDDEVRAIAVQPDSKILVGGKFLNVNGGSQPLVARLTSWGQLDSTFVSPLTPLTANDAVDAVALQQDGKILLGGSFVSGTQVGMVRVLTSGSLDSSFKIGQGATFVSGSNSFAGGVRAIAVQPDGKILVGGNFNTFNGQSYPHLVRLNTDGTIDTSFYVSIDPSGDKSSEVRSIAVDGAGGILIAGEFTSVNGHGLNRMARLNSDGSLDTTFLVGTGASDTVNSISLAGDGSFALGLTLNNSVLGDPVVQGNPYTPVSLFFGVGKPAGYAQFQSDFGYAYAGQPFQVMVNRVGGTHGAVTVNYSTVDGDAVAGVDYVATSGTLTWADGDASPRIITLNALSGNYGGFYLWMETATGGVQIGSPGVMTIYNVSGDTIPEQPINLSPADQATLVPLKPTLTASVYTGSTSQMASEWFVFRKDTGALVYDSQEDFVNRTSLNLPIQLDPATAYEWMVRYEDYSSGWSKFSAPTSFTTHADLGFSLSAPSYFVSEKGAFAKITVRRSVQVADTSTVRFATRNGSAVEGIHYTGTNGTLTFTGTQSSQDILIGIIDNNYPNPNYQFFFDLSNPSAGGTLANPSSALVTIVDNEVPSFYNNAGNYYGLIGVNPTSSAHIGFLSLSVNQYGVFTANVQYGAASYRFTGKLAAYGHFSGLIPKTNLTLDLNLDMTGKDLFTGTISDGTTTASLTANRAVFDAKHFAATQKGAYTVEIPADPNATGDTNPQGDGWGTFNLDGNGKGRFVGALGDNTKVSQNITISRQGLWPFFIPLYKNLGSISGTLQFQDKPKTDVDGNLTWFKPALMDKVLPWGFTVHPKLLGSRYVAPPKDTRVSLFGDYLLNTEVSVIDGSVAVTNPDKFVTWTSNNTFVKSTTEPFSLRIDPRNGLFSGSFLDNTSGKSKNFNGVFLQKANFGGGTFLGNGGTTGRVEIQENLTPTP